jgi:hypothetical protein
LSLVEHVTQNPTAGRTGSCCPLRSISSSRYLQPTTRASGRRKLSPTERAIGSAMGQSHCRIRARHLLALERDCLPPRFLHLHQLRRVCVRGAVRRPGAAVSWLWRRRGQREPAGAGRFARLHCDRIDHLFWHRLPGSQHGPETRLAARAHVRRCALPDRHFHLWPAHAIGAAVADLAARHPLAWAGIGSTAAVLLGVPEDLALLVSGLLAATLLPPWGWRRTSPAA